MGTIARLVMLRVDHRQYPTFPQAYISHLALGFIAAFVGAVSVPALLAREFTAVTFLVLVAQQFREIRSLERDSLERLERSQVVARGPDYIEGIAKSFEARNYMVMLTALVSSAVTRGYGPLLGAAAGLATLAVLARFLQTRHLKDIAVVRSGRLNFRGTLLYVDDIMLMAVGLEEARLVFLERGLGVVIEPKDDNARDTLAGMGQRQAIAHDASAALGVRKDIGHPEFTPVVRRDLETGRLGMVLVAMEPDLEPLVSAVRLTPVLESSRRVPLSTQAGRRAAD